MTPKDPATEVVTVQELADIWGWNRKRAWRYMCDLEAKHGSSVVHKRGRVLFTTRTALAAIGVALPAAIDLRVERRLRSLEEAAREQDARVDALARQVGEFRRQSHEWMASRRKA